MPANIKSNGVDLDNIFLSNAGATIPYNTNVDVNGSDLRQRYAPVDSSTYVNQGSQIPRTNITTSKLPYVVDDEYGLSTLILPFNGSQGSSTIIDNSQYEFSSTTNDVELTTTDYRFGGSCLRFISNSGYIQIGPAFPAFIPNQFKNISPVHPWCVECWVKEPRQNLAGTYSLFSIGKATTTTIPEQYSGTTLGFAIDKTSEFGDFTIRLAFFFDKQEIFVPQQGPFPSANTWNHLAFTYDGAGKLKGYINGKNHIVESLGQQNWVNGAINLPAIYDSVRIGNVGLSLGLIDDVGMYVKTPQIIDDFRLTIGSVKYESDFVAPTYPHQISPIFNYNNANVISSLVLNFNGSNNSTIFTDESYLPKTITANGSAKISTDQYKFDSSSGYFDAASYISWPANVDFSFGTEDFTVEAWIYPTENITEPIRILRMNNGTTTDYTFEVIGYSAVKFFAGASGNSIVWSTLIQSNTWTHIAFTRHAGTFLAFVNGNSCPVASGNPVNNVDIQNTAFNTVPAGDQNGTIYPTTPCYIDNLVVTKKVAKYINNFIVPTIPSSFGPTDVSGLFATKLNQTVNEYILGAKYDLTACTNDSAVITHTVTITFASNADLNSYFDNGGQISILPSYNQYEVTNSASEPVMNLLVNQLYKIDVAGTRTYKNNSGTVLQPNIGGKNVSVTETKLFESRLPPPGNNWPSFSGPWIYEVFLSGNTSTPNVLTLKSVLTFPYTVPGYAPQVFENYYVSEITHRYNPGYAKPSFTAVMTKVDGCGQISYSPATQFIANITTGNAPLTVQFQDLSQIAPTSWAWDFTDDGTTDSVLQNSSYTYTIPGTYDVALTATNSAGSNTMLKSQYIEVTSSLNGVMKLTLDTSKSGILDNTIALPIYTQITINGQTVLTPYNITIDWGDGTPVTIVTSSNTPEGSLSHTYSVEGIYQITITGKLTQYGIPNGLPAYFDLLVSIDEWDNNLGLKYLNGGFAGAKNLTTVPANLPTTVLSTKFLFSDCHIFNDSNVTLWNMTNVRDISGMFINAVAFNQPIGTWNISKVTDASGLFLTNTNSPGPTVFNQNISSWNTSAVVNMSGMFNGATLFNQNIGNWDVSNVTNMDSMFNRAAAFNQDLKSWCVQNISSLPVDFASNGSGLQSSNYPIWGTCPP